MMMIPRSVAIVDDDPSVLRALERLLRARSYNAKTYLSGTQFLASLSEGLPNCVIVDVQMPGMTGLELQHDLANKGLEIPVIIITAHDEPGIRQRCASAGAIAYLTKPVQAAPLLTAIEGAISSSRPN